MKQNNFDLTNTSFNTKTISQITEQKPAEQSYSSLMMSNYQTCNSDTSIVDTLMNVVMQQGKSMRYLLQKVEQMTQKTTHLAAEMKQLQRYKNSNSNCKERQGLIKPQFHQLQNYQEITAKCLSGILFPVGQTYKYHLKVVGDFELTIYRQRNFMYGFSVITDCQGQIVNNSNKIPLTIALYSAENPPKYINETVNGCKILKGYSEQILQYGGCIFKKLQIRQVTSRFKNGWIFIVVIPGILPLTNKLQSANKLVVRCEEIQPLILQKVIVKAKKSKNIKIQNASNHNQQ